MPRTGMWTPLFKLLSRVPDAMAGLSSSVCPVPFPCGQSAVGHALQVLRIAGSLNRDLRGRVFNVAEVIRCQFDLSRSDVLFQPLQPARAWYGHNPGPLGKEPCERDLTGCDAFAFGY